MEVAVRVERAAAVFSLCRHVRPSACAFSIAPHLLLYMYTPSQFGYITSLKSLNACIRFFKRKSRSSPVPS